MLGHGQGRLYTPPWTKSRCPVTRMRATRLRGPDNEPGPIKYLGNPLRVVVLPVRPRFRQRPKQAIQLAVLAVLVTEPFTTLPEPR